MTVRARRVAGASLASMVAAIAPIHLFGALAPEMQDEFGYGDAAQGLAVGVFFAVSAALSSPGGALTDRHGPTPTLRLAAVASGIGAVIIAGAPALWVIVIGLVVAAAGNAVAQPGNNTFISGGVPAHRRGLALGIKQSAIPTSTGLAGLALPVVAATVGWRWAFGYAVVLAVLTVATLPHVEPPSPRRRDDARFRPSTALRMLAVGSAAGAAAVTSIGAFLVRSATDAGFTDTAAGLLQVAGSVTLISTRVGWGALMDRRPIDRFRFAAGLLAVGALAFPLLATGRHGLMIVGALLAYGAGWSWPGVMHLGTVEANPTDMGAASGVVQAGMFTGAMIGPVIFGLVADAHGFGWAWMVSCTASTLAFVLVGVGARLQRRAAGSAAELRP